MINSAGAFYRLTTAGSSTQRVVGFVVMVCTKRLPIKDIEFLVGEWLLVEGKLVRSDSHKEDATYMARMTVETVLVILAL